MAQSRISSPDVDPKPGFFRNTFRLAWQAILLQEEAYVPFRQAERPFWHGFLTLLLILLVVAGAKTIGLALDYLTMPRVDLIQGTLGEVIQGTDFYRERITSTPYLAAIFNLLFQLIWRTIRWVGGYPSRLGIITSFISVVVFGIFNWITYAFIASLVARRLGGSAKRGTIYGVMSLAYAPMLLNVVSLLPGLSVPDGLIALWILATSYLAFRSLYYLSWGRTVLVVILPYFINFLLFILSLVFGIVLGVVLAPYFM